MEEGDKHVNTVEEHAIVLYHLNHETHSNSDQMTQYQHKEERTILSLDITKPVADDSADL